MASIRLFALVYGVAFLLVGICGFVPGLLTHPATTEHVGHTIATGGGTFDGYLFGLFHVNVLHSLVHVAFGVFGLVMCRSVPSSRMYARVVAVAYIILALLGIIPMANTLFGLVPLHGNDVWLHLLLAVPAAYFGFLAAPRDARLDTTTKTMPR